MMIVSNIKIDGAVNEPVEVKDHIAERLIARGMAVKVSTEPVEIEGPLKKERFEEPGDGDS